MPIDPRIALGVQAPQIQSPLEALSSIAQLQGIREQTEVRRLAGEKARQQAADEATLRTTMTETGGDIDKALPLLRQRAPHVAFAVEEQVGKARKESMDALTKQTELRGKQVDLGTRLLQGVTDDASYQLVRPMIRTLSPQIADAMGDAYDPARVQQFLQVGLSAKELNDQRQNALKLLTEGKAAEGVGTWLSTARTPEEWQGALAGAKHLGVPDVLLTQFGDFSPDNVKRAATLAITPTKRAELAGQEAQRAQTAAQQAATLAVSRGHLAVAQGQLDVARQRLAKGSGTDQDREALMQAVIDSPGLWDQITPTERGKIAGELNTRGFTGFGKPLSDAAVKQISESKSAIASLGDLRETIKKNEQYVGPIGSLAALNPYSEARKAQADIDRVRQRVGKALEGGVLRKEDEEKYKKILATLSDVPSTALYKIDSLTQDLQRDIDTYTHQQRLAGRRVPQSEPAPGTSTAARPAAGGGGAAGLTYQDYMNARKPRP